MSPTKTILASLGPFLYESTTGMQMRIIKIGINIFFIDLAISTGKKFLKRDSGARLARGQAKFLAKNLRIERKNIFSSTPLLNFVQNIFSPRFTM
jgi:hypothetical protein